MDEEFEPEVYCQYGYIFSLLIFCNNFRHEHAESRNLGSSI